MDAQILQGIDPQLLAVPEGRRELTRLDPLLFALIYLPHHLENDDGEITISEFHVDLAEWAKTLIKRQQSRDAFIAPRGCGKSTWLFLIIPMWAAAHGFVKFIAAFSDAANQAEGHLLTFKHELDNNEYLRSDFPELCLPKLVASTNKPLANNAWRIIQQSGFVFDANGIDTNSLGKKVGSLRPDFIILDDIEPGEKNYSEYQMKQQRATVFDDISGMNTFARMIFVGTTTMPNSIMDQFRKWAEGFREPDLQWIADQHVEVHYYPAILTNPDGSERSIWQEKWSLAWLQGRRHLRDFAKNFMNRPLSADSQLWEEADIEQLEPDDYGNTLLSVDPAVTKGRVSDFTGLAVLSRGSKDGTDALFVREAIQVRLSPADLALRVTQMVEQFDVGLIYVEVNQGGDLWREVFKDVPCKFRAVKQSTSKHVRAGKALNYYQQGKVKHVKHFPALVEQMLAFPHTPHDDVLDAVVSGVLYFLDSKAVPVTATQFKYRTPVGV